MSLKFLAIEIFVFGFIINIQNVNNPQSGRVKSLNKQAEEMLLLSKFKFPSANVEETF